MAPRSFSYKFRVIYFCLFVLVFLVGFPILIFYSAGYSWDDTFGISARGGLYVFTPVPDTSVFIGNELRNVSGFFNKELLLNDLKPDQYAVLATNDDYWPWAKVVAVKEGEVEALTPLLVPKVIETEEILTTDPLRKTILGVFATSTATSYTGTSTPGAVIKKNVKIWHAGPKLFAQWLGNSAAVPSHFCLSGACDEPVEVFEAFMPIKTVDFYPYRDDAIILTLDTGVYVIEIDKRPTQNFYPLYRGKEPDFRVYRNQVYVKDGSYIGLLNLEL